MRIFGGVGGVGGSTTDGRTDDDGVVVDVVVGRKRCT